MIENSTKLFFKAFETWIFLDFIQYLYFLTSCWKEMFKKLKKVRQKMYYYTPKWCYPEHLDLDYFLKFSLHIETNVQRSYLCQRLPRLHCHKLIISPYNSSLRVCLTLWLALMCSFLHSAQTIRDVLPACGPLHHQPALIWSFASKKGVCVFEERGKGFFFFFFLTCAMCEISACSVTAPEAGQ